MEPIVQAAIIIAFGLAIHAFLSSTTSSSSSLNGLYIKHGLDAVARAIERLTDKQE